MPTTPGESREQLSPGHGLPRVPWAPCSSLLPQAVSAGLGLSTPAASDPASMPGPTRWPLSWLLRVEASPPMWAHSDCPSPEHPGCPRDAHTAQAGRGPTRDLAQSQRSSAELHALTTSHLQPSRTSTPTALLHPLLVPPILSHLFTVLTPTSSLL